MDHFHRLFGLISIHVPLAGDDAGPFNGALYLDISIHVPLAGDDMIFTRTFNACWEFQSTSPLRGTTAEPHKMQL